jgi:hypothetical protein
MNRPAPLSPEARQLLELGSHVEPPTLEQNERMDRALALLFRAGRAGPSPGAGSPLGGSEQRSASPANGAGTPHHGGRLHDGGTASSQRSGLHARPRAPRATPGFLQPWQGLNGSKLWLALGALAATAGASFWLGRLSTPTDEARVAASSVTASSVTASSVTASDVVVSSVAASRVGAPTELAPVLAPAPEVPEVLATLESAAPRASAASMGSAASTASAGPIARAAERPAAAQRGAPPARGSLGLAAEIEQLARVEAALRQGRPAHALVVLEQRSVQHLLEQAAALRAIAECDLGGATAIRRARDTLERWPASAFQARIANACGL